MQRAADSVQSGCVLPAGHPQYIFEYILNMGIIIFLVKILGINEIIAPLIAPIFSTPPVFFLMRAAIKNNE